MKTCSRCKIDKATSDFCQRKASKDGLSPSCRSCMSKDKKAQRGKLGSRSPEEIEKAAAARFPRTCSGCKIDKEATGFPVDRGRRDGRSTVCLLCNADKVAAYRTLVPQDELKRRKQLSYRKNYDTTRDYRLRADYGITLERYSDMMTAQGGVCAICNQPETSTRNGRVIDLAVDHDHSSGAVRALLCSNCNRGIGHLQDSSDLLRRAAAYLESHMNNYISEEAS